MEELESQGLMLNEEKKKYEEKLVAETQAREEEHNKYLVNFLINLQKNRFLIRSYYFYYFNTEISNPICSVMLIEMIEVYRMEAIIHHCFLNMLEYFSIVDRLEYILHFHNLHFISWLSCL